MAKEAPKMAKRPPKMAKHSYLCHLRKSSKNAALKAVFG